jgi:hypothetical protein
MTYFVSPGGPRANAGGADRDVAALLNATSAERKIAVGVDIRGSSVTVAYLSLAVTGDL